MRFAMDGVGCSYLARAAEACLEQMTQLSCPDPLAVTGEELPLPVVCVDEVWLDCDPSEGPSDSESSTGDTDAS